MICILHIYIYIYIHTYIYIHIYVCYTYIYTRTFSGLHGNMIGAKKPKNEKKYTTKQPRGGVGDASLARLGLPPAGLLFTTYKEARLRSALSKRASKGRLRLAISEVWSWLEGRPKKAPESPEFQLGWSLFRGGGCMAEGSTGLCYDEVWYLTGLKRLKRPLINPDLGPHMEL